jgi:hypothetical protein
MAIKLPAKLKQPNDEWVISYRIIRIVVGWLGIALPFICVLGAWLVGHCAFCYQYSISDYYYTVMRTAFTGTLCAVSLFLFAYRGPQRIDAILGNLAGIFALGVVFFPTEPAAQTTMAVIGTDCNLVVADPGTPFTSVLHYISAALFFSVLVLFSMWLFRIKGDDPTPQKLKRNKWFWVCGWIMIGALLLILAHKFIKPLHDWWLPIHPVFWLEAIALWAFGVSWLVKAEVVFGDGKK